MITEKDLSKSQLKYFRKEDDEQRKIILHALNRKPIHKKLKSGFILDGAYGYVDGMIVYITRLFLSDHVVWNDAYMSDSWELALDGYETRERLLEIFYDMLWCDICDEESGYNFLKRLL